MRCFRLVMQYAVTGGWWLTCSETRVVCPNSSSQWPVNNSPRKGFSGFFSDPSFSEREQYCCFNVLSSHFITRRARLAGSCSWVGAIHNEVFSVQYAENSTRDWVDRMKAGAVKEDRSPLNEAIDCMSLESRTWIEQHDCLP